MSEVKDRTTIESSNIQDRLNFFLLLHWICCFLYLIIYPHPISMEEYALFWKTTSTEFVLGFEQSWTFRNLYFILQSKFYLTLMHTAMLFFLAVGLAKESPQYLEAWIFYSSSQCIIGIVIFCAGLIQFYFSWPWVVTGIFIGFHAFTVFTVYARRKEMQDFTVQRTSTAKKQVKKVVNSTGLESRRPDDLDLSNSAHV